VQCFGLPLHAHHNPAVIKPSSEYHKGQNALPVAKPGMVQCGRASDFGGRTHAHSSVVAALTVISARGPCSKKEKGTPSLRSEPPARRKATKFVVCRGPSQSGQEGPASPCPNGAMMLPGGTSPRKDSFVLSCSSSRWLTAFRAHSHPTIDCWTSFPGRFSTSGMGEKFEREADKGQLPRTYGHFGPAGHEARSSGQRSRRFFSFPMGHRAVVDPIRSTRDDDHE